MLVARTVGVARTRIVTVDHATLSIQYANWGPLTALSLRATIGLVYPFAHRRIAVSQGVAEDVSALGGRSPLLLMDVVLNPVRKPLYDRGAHDAAERAWGGWGGFRIITVGTFKTQKRTMPCF